MSGRSLSCPVVLLLLVLCLAVPASAAPETAGRLVFAQGPVSLSAAGGGGWRSAAIGQELMGGDSVRTGPGGRAAILCSDETQIRLGENTLVTLKAVVPSPRLGFASSGDAPANSVYGLDGGEAWIRNNNEASKFHLETPALTAAVRGTEFTARVDASGFTSIALLEGGLQLANARGSLELSAGELGGARPGEAPFKQVLVNPEDAVQWVLYYPTAVSLRELAPDRLDISPPLRAKAEGWLDLARSGRAGEAWEAARKEAEAAPASPGLCGLAAYLALGAGHPERARQLLDRTLAVAPADAFCLALSAQMDLARNRKAEALAKAQKAVESSPSSPSAHVSVALARLSRFELEKAMEEIDKALELDPSCVSALVYKARIELGTDSPDKALGTASRALAIAPGEPMALALAGFAQLGLRRFDQARALFARAAAAGPDLPEPRLGLGLVAFSRNERFEGLSQMLAATLLDPRVSLYQTSLGKGYYASRAFGKAMESYAQAARLDPADPTPHLYRGIALTDLYRPGEAVESLNRSIALNDNRAMFRSRLLLDRDLAVRNFDLAKAFNQLGLGEWAFAKALTSVKKDPFESSAHLFLSGAFAATRQRVAAASTELLLYRLLSPANQNTFTLYNDYTPMFEAPYLRAQLTATGGLWANGNPSGEAGLEAYGGIPGVAGDVLLSYFHDQGMRQTNGQDRRAFAVGQFKWEPTVKDSLYAALTLSRDLTGDLSNLTAWEYRPSPWQANAYRNTDLELGYVRRFAPGWTFIGYGSAKWNDWDFTNRTYTPAVSFLESLPLDAVDLTSRETPRSTWNLQAQQQLTLGSHSLVAGADIFSSLLKYRLRDNYLIPLLPTLNTLTATNHDSWDRSVSVYLQDYWQVCRGLTLELGLSGEFGSTPRFGFNSQVEDSLLGWRFGLNWEATGKDVIRLAAQRYLNMHFTQKPSLQPSEVAGFPTRVNADDGSRVIEAGAAWERQWDEKTFTVARGDFHHIENPQFDPRQITFDRRLWFTSDRWLLSASLNRVLAPFLGLNLAGTAKWVEPGELDRRILHSPRFTELSAGGGLTLLYVNGLGAAVTGLLVKQAFPDGTARDLLGRRRDEAPFFLLGARLSYDFPGKRGFAALEGSNLLDVKFSYVREPVALNAFVPARKVFLKLGLYF